MLSVRTNMLAWNAGRQFGITNSKSKKSTEKLSSGYRINRSADDAAGLAISEKMRRQIRGLTQASLNAQDGISMVQSAEGALNEIHEMLQRANELAVKAANGTLTEDDRAMVDAEIQQIKNEINTTAQHTVFNEMRLFPDDGLWPSMAFPSEIYEYNLHYNLNDGSVTVDMVTASGALSSTAAMGRAGVAPVSQGGALADILATQLIPDAANQIFGAFPSLKNAVGSETIDLKVIVSNIDGRDKRLAYAYFEYMKAGGRPTFMKIEVDSSDFTVADAEGTGARAEALQSTIAHELTHSIMQYTMTDGMSGRKNGYAKYPEWFTEGVAQLSGGGFPTQWNNDLIAIANQLSGAADDSLDSQIERYLKRYTVDNRPYGHGYLAAAYAGYVAGGGGSVTGQTIARGMDKIFADLISGMTLDQALQKNTGMTGEQLQRAINNANANVVEFVRKLSYESRGGAGSVITSSLSVGGSAILGGGGANPPFINPTPGNPAGGKPVALQVGSESGQHIAFELYQMNTAALGLWDTNVKTEDAAGMAINEIKRAIGYVSGVRSAYGAVQNRLEHSISNLDNVVENTSAAESAIRDTDMAQEMVRYSNQQILLQAGTAILAQANKHSEVILGLLG